MKSWISKTAFAIAIALALPVLAHADTWQIDPAHTNVEFSCAPHDDLEREGAVSKNLGNDHHQRQRPCLGENRCDHRRVVDQHAGRQARRTSEESRHFSTSTKYPTITFKSTKVEAAGPGKWKVTGDLTLHGVTKPVVLEVEGSGTPIHRSDGQYARGRIGDDENQAQ